MLRTFDDQEHAVNVAVPNVTRKHDPVGFTVVLASDGPVGGGVGVTTGMLEPLAVDGITDGVPPGGVGTGSVVVPAFTVLLLMGKPCEGTPPGHE